MTDVVNLRSVRKARDREAATAANRAKHGRTEQQKLAERIEQERRTRELDGAEIERAKF